MDDFSFENNFCQYFKCLRENTELFVSFSINQCQSILNDKITISLPTMISCMLKMKRVDWASLL